MKEFGDSLKNKLYGGHLWNPSYYVATVSENTEDQVDLFNLVILDMKDLAAERQ